MIFRYAAELVLLTVSEVREVSEEISAEEASTALLDGVV
jgi:hypothetical protein